MSTYRLFPSTNGPSSLTGAGAGNFQAGVAFQVTSGGMWFQGYWWWVPPGGDVGAQTFALWQITSTDHSVSSFLVPGGAVTSGALTAGQWNYVPLSAPIALSQNLGYVAVTGWHVVNGFPDTQSQFGAGETYSAGIVSGPLSAYSDQNGSNPAPENISQGLFGTGGASGGSASANFPGSGSDTHSNFWMDLQVSDTAPSGASYQLVPSQPYPMNWEIDNTTPLGQVVSVGTEFLLSQSCALNAILFYSPPDVSVTQLPSACAIYSVSTQAVVSGTLNSSPSWSGAAASGWVSCSYSGVTLPAGDYKTVVANAAGTWNSTTGPDYWISPGPAASGIVNGPLSAPNNATATSPGQSTYQVAAGIAYPATHVSGDGYTYWVDVRVSPPAVAGGAAALTGTGTLAAGGQKSVPGAAALTGAGLLTAAGRKQAPGAVAMTGSGALIAAGSASVPGAAALTGAGAMTAGGNATRAGAAAMTGAGTLTATGTRSAPSAAVLFAVAQARQPWAVTSARNT